MRSSRESHSQAVVLQHFHRRLSVSSFIGRKHSLTVEEYFIAADFVRASPITVGNGNTQQPFGTGSTRKLSVRVHELSPGHARKNCM
jgi:hypothetical protein